MMGAVPIRILAILLMVGVAGWYASAIFSARAAAQSVQGVELPMPILPLAFILVPVALSIWKTGAGQRIGLFIYIAFCLLMLTVDYRGYMAALAAGQTMDVVYRIAILLVPLPFVHLATRPSNSI